MQYISAFPFKTFLLLLIIQVQLSSQNVGIGTNTPTSVLHLKSTVQNITSLNLDFETGTIDPENTNGDYDWYITGTDGYNSAKCVKAPLMLNATEKALLSFGYNLSLGKEITVTFDYKYDDPTNQVAFLMSINDLSFSPPSHPDWKNYSTTFISQSNSGNLKISVSALQDEAFPIVHIDNIIITFDDGHVLKIEDGTEGDGLILQSDALGHTEWIDLREEIDQKISDNLQDLDFDTIQNALFIEDGNGVLISSLKNHNGKSLRLSGNSLIGTQGMSFYIPRIDVNNSSLRYDGNNNTMDWGVVDTTLKGNFSTRWGWYNTASNIYSTAWGVNNVSSGKYSTTWGFQNNASGNTSTSWGKSNIANELNSTSFGYDNVSSGQMSTSWGEDNTASSTNSTAWGENNTSSSVRSTAWGINNTANYPGSTVWGTGNIIGANNGTGWGSNNEITSSANTSTVCGANNLANGYYSFVSGHYNEANSFGEVAFGRYNKSPDGDKTSWDSNDLLFSLGNGINSAFKRNALSVLKNGNVGIGEDSPIYNLHLANDSAAKPGSSSWTVSSDRRLKKDIIEFTDGMDIISAIEPVWFTYNGLADIQEGTYIGTIAQDLEKVAPYMVSEFTHKNEEGTSQNYKAVNYGAMDFVLINAIKEQQIEIADLKAQITEILSLLTSDSSFDAGNKEK